MPPTEKIENGDSTIRILITTDNHVGYNENDSIRGDDSWRTFDEITHIAKEQDVDMMIQGGDLFHINKPSKKSLYQVIKSLRANCLGNKACEIELLSDALLALGGESENVNYEDPNINVSIPVFAISGNHDDATGQEMLLPLDLLAAAGLINHFGKVKNNEDITISPLLFRKGTTNFALYGLGNVKDERLYRMFRDGRVKFMRPSKNSDQYFSILCVHQNHTPHTRTSYLPELFLPGFFNLVIWGHEHECIPFPVHNPSTGFDTLQPGSSVVTSLCDSECTDKNVFVISIKGKAYSIEPIRLRTVRPFVIGEVSLQEEGFVAGPASKEDISKFLAAKIETLIDQANEEYLQASDNKVTAASSEEAARGPLPLIRLRVGHNGDYELENPRRFSNKFVGKIANIDDVVHFYRKRPKEHALQKNKSKFTEIQDSDIKTKVDDIRLQDLMTQFLHQAELNLIPEDGINFAVKKSVENDDKHILTDYIKDEIEQETQTFLQMRISEESFENGGEEASRRNFKKILNRIKEENTHRARDDSRFKLNDINNSFKINKVNSSEVVISDSESDSNSAEKIPIAKTTRKKKHENHAVSTINKKMPLDHSNKKSIASERKKPERSITKRKSVKSDKHNKEEEPNSKRSLLDDIMNLGT